MMIYIEGKFKGFPIVSTGPGQKWGVDFQSIIEVLLSKMKPLKLDVGWEKICISAVTSESRNLVSSKSTFPADFTRTIRDIFYRLWAFVVRTNVT
jgi:hypothetical protein